MSCDPRKDICWNPNCDGFNMGGMNPHCEAHQPTSPLAGPGRSVRPGRTHAVPDSDVACADELREHLTTCETCRMADDRVAAWCPHAADLAHALGWRPEDAFPPPLSLTLRVLNQARGIVVEQERMRTLPPWPPEDVARIRNRLLESAAWKNLDVELRRGFIDSAVLDAVLGQPIDSVVAVRALIEMRQQLRSDLGVS